MLHLELIKWVFPPFLWIDLTMFPCIQMPFACRESCSHFSLVSNAQLRVGSMLLTFTVFWCRPLGFLQDGTANYFKGLMLVLCYSIVGASFFVHLDHSEWFDSRCNSSNSELPQHVILMHQACWNLFCTISKMKYVVDFFFFPFPTGIQKQQLRARFWEIGNRYR